MTGNASTERIITCHKCGSKNRISAHSDLLCPICGRCKARLLPFSKISKAKFHHPITFLDVIFNASIVIAIVGVCYAMAVTPKILAKDYSGIISKEEEKTASFKQEQEKHFAEVETQLQKELSKIDAEELRHKALQSYEVILDARRSFDRRYALTPREKSQFHMQEFADDSTKTYHQAVIAIAKEASPKGADISISGGLSGTALNIDFDMSSMTSGERGARTKHLTKESLKKEVISLISRVTNDVFQFCKNLDLDTIYVGCRHHANTHYPDGSVNVENMMLYKISIKKSKVRNLSNNPFLDVYSTTQYLKVKEDNFSEIEISTIRI